MAKGRRCRIAHVKPEPPFANNPHCGKPRRRGAGLRVGIVHVNDQTVADEPFAPFGGTGASGNGAAHGGPANWDTFTRWQWMTMRAKPPAYPF
jgi:benzaldehyde dehydrogenase (NAD)